MTSYPFQTIFILPRKVIITRFRLELPFRVAFLETLGVPEIGIDVLQSIFMQMQD